MYRVMPVPGIATALLHAATRQICEALGETAQSWDRARVVAAGRGDVDFCDRHDALGAASDAYTTMMGHVSRAIDALLAGKSSLRQAIMGARTASVTGTGCTIGQHTMTSANGEAYVAAWRVLHAMDGLADPPESRSDAEFDARVSVQLGPAVLARRAACIRVAIVRLLPPGDSL